MKNDLDKNMVSKIIQAKSIGELEQITKKAGLSLTSERLNAMYEDILLNNSAMSDEELENISGGKGSPQVENMPEINVCEVCGSTEEPMCYIFTPNQVKVCTQCWIKHYKPEFDALKYGE